MKTATELLIDGQIVETMHKDLNEALEFIFSHFSDTEIAEIIEQPAMVVVLRQANDPDQEIGELHIYQPNEILGLKDRLEMHRRKQR